MTSTINAVKKYADTILMVVLILFVGVGLVKNLHYFISPDNDFISFYYPDARQLIQFSLPGSFAPPLYTFMTAAILSLAPSISPEISARILNIIILLSSGIFLWKLGKRSLGYFSVIPVFHFLTNPITWHATLQPTRMPLFAFTTILSLLLFFYNHTKKAYIVAAIACFVRYEGIAIILSLAFADMLHGVSASRVCRKIFFSLLPIALWVLILLIFKLKIADLIFYSQGLTSGEFSINTLFLWNAFSRIPFFHESFPHGIIAGSVIVYLFVGGILAWSWGKREFLTAFCFVLLNTIIHLFTYETQRHTFTLLWALYLLFLWPLAKRTSHYKLIKSLLCILLCAVGLRNITLIHPYLYQKKFFKAQYKYAAEWIANSSFIQFPILVISREAYLTNYYLPNHLPVQTIDIMDEVCLARVSCLMPIAQKYSQNDIVILNKNTIQLWSARFSTLKMTHILPLPPNGLDEPLPPPNHIVENR